MAQFKKGEGGRPKGKPNKITTLQRGFIQSLLDTQQAKIKATLDSLEGKDYLNVIASFMEFVMPKLQRAELVTSEPEPPPVIVIEVVNPIDED